MIVRGLVSRPRTKTAQDFATLRSDDNESNCSLFRIKQSLHPAGESAQASPESLLVKRQQPFAGRLAGDAGACGLHANHCIFE